MDSIVVQAMRTAGGMHAAGSGLGAESLAMPFRARESRPFYPICKAGSEAPMCPRGQG
jgi:hypothetical protein